MVFGFWRKLFDFVFHFWRDIMANTDFLSIAQGKKLGNKIIGDVKAKNYAVSATTLEGYGIADAYTKTEVDNAIGEVQAGAYKPGGSLTAAEVASTLLVAGNIGKVYNVSEDFVTTTDFVEGAGKALPAGTDIVVVDSDNTGTSPVYKFNVLSGAYGVATQSGNGLMSSTDKTKLDNADVTAYTGAGAIEVNNHEISVSPATPSTSGTGGSAGSMSAADKEKLDNADVTAYSQGNGILINDHTVSANVVDANGLSNGATGIGMAIVSASASGVGGSNGAMLATDKEKLDSFAAASNADVDAMIAELDSL